MKTYLSTIRFTTALATVGVLSACAISSPRFNSSPKVETRDVPFAAREADSAVRKRVMVLPFLDRDGRSQTTQTVAARDAVVNTMRLSGDYVFVNPTEFPKDVASYFKNSSYDLEQMAKMGGTVGLNAIVEGKILEIRAKRIGDDVGLVRKVRARIDATVQIRMVNTKNAVVVFNETRSAQIEDAVTRVGERSETDRYLESDPQLIDQVITKAFQSAIPKMAQTLEKLSWEGRIALVKGERIFVNAGRLSGLQIGDLLKVAEDGEDVYDPDTGALIGKVPGRLKGTIEVISYFGKDGSIGIVHSGSGFKEQDRIELY